MEELENLYFLGLEEHFRRAKWTKGRLETAHQIFRIILETVPRFIDYPSWEKVPVSVSFLDFVVVGGLEQLQTLSCITEELRGGLPATRSLYALHHYVMDYAPARNALYDGRQTTLTRILREALAGDAHSLFLCTCNPDNINHTLTTLRFAEKAKWLVQHPMKKVYSSSVLHATIRQALHHYQAAKKALRSRKKTSKNTSITITEDEEVEQVEEIEKEVEMNLKEEDEKEEEDDDMEQVEIEKGMNMNGNKEDEKEEEEVFFEVENQVEQEVEKMLSLASSIFPINSVIKLRGNEEEAEEEAPKKKRGRPRKCPIKVRPFVPERPAKTDYIALWKSHYLSFHSDKGTEEREENVKEKAKQKEEKDTKMKGRNKYNKEEEETKKMEGMEEKKMKGKMEKFYMAGKYDLITTTKPIKLANLYRIGSLRESDPNVYYGGFLEDLKKGKEEEEEVEDGDRQREKERINKENYEEIEEENTKERNLGKAKQRDEINVDVEREKIKEAEEMRRDYGGKEEKTSKVRKIGMAREDRKKKHIERDVENEETEALRRWRMTGAIPKVRNGKKEDIKKRTEREIEREKRMEESEENKEKTGNTRPVGNKERKENELKEQNGEKGEEGRGKLELVNYVKGSITITKRWDVCVDGEMKQYLDKEYELKDYKPKKVSFSLKNMMYRDLKWKLDDGFVHFLRLTLWIQYFRHELAQRKDGRLVYSMPDFISLKEVFLDIFLTPYRRSARLWKLKAVSFEDGRVYIQSDHTIACTPEKLSAKTAFSTHLMGLCHPDTVTTTTTTRSKERRLVSFPGQYWEVFWGEVDGLGLCYSSQVDLIDRSSQFLSNLTSTSSAPSSSSFLSTSAMSQLVKVISKRLYMYRTLFYPPPRDTKAWRERMWFTLLEWWADYQFGKVPSIIGGELENHDVTAIRLFCAQTLPQLAEAWCEKPAWDQTLGFHYLSSLLRFIKYWCNRRPRETLSFELQENGDVLCCKRKFSIASRHFHVSSILPEEFIKDLYPAPPHIPKPDWPGKRGRKYKPRKAASVTRPRRSQCYWKLPRYSEVEHTPPLSPPRYVSRPGLGKREEDKGGDMSGEVQEDKGEDILPKHPIFPHSLIAKREKKAQEGRTLRHKTRPRYRPKRPIPKDFKGLTRPQISRWVDKRAREWYKSTLPANVLPKMLIPEDVDEEDEVEEDAQKYLDKLLFSSSPSSSSDEETEETRKMIKEVLFSPLPRTKHTKRSKTKRKQAIREDDEAYEDTQENAHHCPLPSRPHPKKKRVKKAFPVIPLPEDDASYSVKKENVEMVACRGDLSTKSDEEGLSDMMGVL